MFDPIFRRFIEKPLQKLAVPFVRYGISPNQITITGFIFGLFAATALFLNLYLSAAFLIILNRLCDGLDGAIARSGAQAGKIKPTDLGSYLDIVLDMIIYGLIPFSFVAGLESPTHMHWFACALLLFSYMGTSCSFLAYAIIAEKRALKTEARGKKSFFHHGGLAEGSETFLVMLLICLLPEFFVTACLIYAAMCLITTFMRIGAAVIDFKEN